MAPQRLLVETQASAGCVGRACGGGGARRRQSPPINATRWQRRATGLGPAVCTWQRLGVRGGRHGHACRHRPRPSGWVGGDSSGACSAGTGGACSVAETGAGGLGACCAALATVCGVAAVAGCSVCRVGARPGVDQVGSGGGAGVEHGAGGPGAGSRQAGQAKTKAAPPRPAGGEAWGSKNPTAAEKASEAKVAKKLRHQGFPGDPSTQY